MELLPPDPTRLLAENGLPLDIRGRPLSSARRESLVVDAISVLSGRDEPAGPAEIAGGLGEARSALLAEMGQGGGWALAGRYAALCEGAIDCLADYALAESGEAGWPAAVVATGGFGRAELFPCSDIDVAVIPAPKAGPALDPFVRALHRAVFDCMASGLGLDVGYQFRPIEDIRSLDDTTACSLLDGRLLCGDREVYRSFQAELRRVIDPARALLALRSEREARGLTRGSSLYRLEPNLKTHPGGIRDLGYALWIARLAFARPSSVTVGEACALLSLPRTTRERIAAAVAALFDLRWALHVCTGRKGDTLYSSQHETVAALLFPDADRPTAAMLQARIASGVELHAFADRVIERSLSRELSVGGGLVLVNGRVAREPARPPSRDAEDDNLIPAPPLRAGDCLRAVAVHMRSGAELSAELRAAVADAASEVRPAAPGFGAEFMHEILTHPRAPSALRMLRDLGLLSRLIPPTEPAIGAIPADPSHEFAICEHSLRVIDNLFELRDATRADLEPLARLWRDLTVEEQRTLVFATLCHDMGKPVSPRDHMRAGGVICREIGEALALPGEDVDLAVRLIELHLEMAHRSRTLDLEQDATIRAFAELMGDIRTLNLLYLLTYADTKGVGLGVFGDVERRLLDDLYARTLAALAEEGMPERDLREAAGRIRERAVRELRVPGVSDDRIREHCDEMPPLYVVATPLPVLGMHIAMVRDLAKRDEPIVDFYAEPGRDYTELTICCYDDPEPGLFSRIAAALLGAGINVHGAQIRTRSGRRQVVLDTLMVDYRGKALPDDIQERAGRLLTDVLLGRISPEDLLISRGRSLPARAVIERLTAHNDMSDQHTVVWVTVEDKTGLLFRVTRALAVSGLYLHTAKITTWQASAQNVFYVTRAEGGKVPDSDLERTVAALHEAIEDIPEAIREPE